MPGIVARRHWIERQCERIGAEIRRRHQAELEHADAGVRKQARRAVDRETREAIAGYLKTVARRSTPRGLILH